MIHRQRLISLIAVASVAMSGQSLSAQPVPQSQTPAQLAQAALDAAPVFDGHNDVPIQLRARLQNRINSFDFADTTDTADAEAGRKAMHTDLARLKKGRVGAQFWSVYVPGTITEPEAVQMTLEQIDVTRRLIARNSDGLQLALTAEDVERAMASGRVASMLGMEGGHSIGSSLAVLRQMFDLGVRCMTLTHSRNTPWADSASDKPAHGGLSEFGREVVREMNRLGMVVDLSHVSEDAMMDALDAARAPVLFSHSGARAVNGHSRNVPDAVLARLKQNGGVVMVVALPGYLSEARRQWYASYKAEEARLAYLWEGQPDRSKAALDAWQAANPEPQATVSDMADHIDHIRKIAGVEHIGVGGDYDGMPTGPVGMEDVAGYPALFEELARRGYSQTELEMIASRNTVRVLRAVETFAASQAGVLPSEALAPSSAPS